MKSVYRNESKAQLYPTVDSCRQLILLAAMVCDAAYTQENIKLNCDPHTWFVAPIHILVTDRYLIIRLFYLFWSSRNLANLHGDISRAEWSLEKDQHAQPAAV